MNGDLKAFEEVFPGFRAQDELAMILKDTQVAKVTMNKKRDLLRVYIVCNRCVHKSYIYLLEEMIKKQLFGGYELQVKVIEQFQLSRLYTLEKLLELYRDSIEMELQNYSRYLGYAFHKAELSVEEDTLLVKLADNTVSRENENQLYELLDKILNERCHMQVRIRMEYQEVTENKSRAYNEKMMIAAARQIVARTNLRYASGPEEEAKAAAEEAANAAADGSAGNAAGMQGKRDAGSGQKRKNDHVAVPAKAAAQAGNKTKAVPAGSNTAGGRSTGKGAFSGSKSGKGKFDRPMIQSNNPDVYYGRDFEGDSTPIHELDESSGEVIIRGQIIAQEGRELRNERGLIEFAVTDDTDTIKTKIFIAGDKLKEMGGKLKKGSFVKVKGKVVTDSFDHDLAVMSVFGIKKSTNFRSTRMDNSPEKRVELHCHTKMSDMDGVTDAKALVKRAYEWGHPAIAITDHGVVQAFPEANHAMEDIDRAYRSKYQEEHPEATKEELKKISAPFKVIYGMEAYIVDDLKGIAVNSKGQSLHQPYVVFDIETTGLSNQTCKIIEIGAVRVEEGKIVSRYSTFVNPETPIPMKIEQLTSITDSMVVDAPVIEKILPEFMEFCEGAVMVAHNADFDMSFIIKECERQKIEREFTYVDTIAIARVLLPGMTSFKLDKVAKAVNVVLDHHHRAVDDAACTAEIFVKFVKMLDDRGVHNLDELNEMGSVSDEAKKKLASHHAIILATGEVGRVNLYRLVSASHLNYFYRNQARLPKSLVEKYREGLLLGTACVAGELYDALLRGATASEITRIVNFYDYLEIQPLGNNAFLINDEKTDHIRSMEDLQDMNRQIVRLGEQFKKPVVATCDVHFMDPEDEVYRRIIMAGKKFKDADDQSPLFLHTTEEMMEEFAYLGRDKAREVVIENPQKICDMCEKISPIRAGKFPPVIEDSDKTLREICYRRAKEIYGPELPEIVEARLERELNSIISNGYAVMYIIAQKLVWKSNEDGYLVGSRGSVGSSFVATMSGITEVNPLAPHYLCESCFYVDFESELVKKYKNLGMGGCDMPDAICPKCGKPLKKMGFNIPFETFLGFKGNKEPDIDLNFSGEYQSKAHKYTEVIFGAGQTFRAGTIGTLADKTAFGYVKNYYEERGEHKRVCEIDRIVNGCVGIRRTTGQHPGGIIVLPFGEDINAFTPVQHPADDSTSDIITTHFDYHSIDANLLKLDILGHDDPTMIRMLEDLTGTDATDVPLDEPAVMSLFRSTEALGIKPEQIGGIPLGSLGVPEFGTDFVIQMLQDTKPERFSDLIRISGLSHGTDVWLGNAQTLIQEGKCTISSAICTRDDIMVYLIGKGLESELSFTIMESVRKGKGLKEEWIKEMKAHDVPDWYIWSCKKIKYMFPKAHAVAYVMMAYRIAWYKIYHPLAYYAAYFSIRASAFNYEKMCMGPDRLQEHIDDFKKRSDSLTAQEKDQWKDMKSVQEMYARGFEFMPIDLYKAQAHRFQIIDGKLMPALDTIDGLGDKAADGVVLAAREGKFLSKDDFRKRAKVGKTISDTLDRLGIFGQIPETNQISLFDFAM